MGDQSKIEPSPTIRADGESEPRPSGFAAILRTYAPKKSRFTARFWLAFGGVAVAAAGFLAWSYLTHDTAYTYTTQRITRGDLTVIVTATGTVQPVAKVDVSSPVSGIMRKVNVDYNSIVRKGEVLAEIDTDNLRATVASARASLRAASANMVKAKAAADAAVVTHKRQLALRNLQASSQQGFEDAQLAMETAMSELKASEAQVFVARGDLQQAETNLSRAIIVSPIDGLVLTRNIDPGATVAASLSAPVLFSIAGDLKQMKVQVDVDEADIGEVKVGQKATFTVDAYRDRTFIAEITDIRFVSETVNNVVTYKAELKVDNRNMLLRPGMTATADIIVQNVRSKLLIPNAALRYTPPEPATGGSVGVLSLFGRPHLGAVTKAELRNATRSIWVMRDKVPVEVPVKIGATDGRNTVIDSGAVSAGDVVVTNAVAEQ